MYMMLLIVTFWSQGMHLRGKVNNNQNKRIEKPNHFKNYYMGRL